MPRTCLIRWSLVQGWCDANVNRVLVAEEASLRRRPPRQPAAAAPTPEQQLRALLYHGKVRMGLKLPSLEELGEQTWASSAAASSCCTLAPAPCLQLHVQQPPMRSPTHAYAQRGRVPAPVPSLPSAAQCPTASAIRRQLRSIRVCPSDDRVRPPQRPRLRRLNFSPCLG